MIYLMRPIVVKETEQGHLKADLWDSLARHEAAEKIPSRGRVTAFFKRVDNKLLLDWEMFVQSRDRLLEAFASERNGNEKLSESTFTPFILQLQRN